MLSGIKEVKLPENNFPTLWQTVIFRNYGYVKAENIARVLSCDVNTVVNEAERLGLLDVKYNPVWKACGYITLIRNNWYLLSYEDICTLLEIDEKRLEYILENDDFLFHKLGFFKPLTPSVKYSPLTNEQIIKTEKIKSIVENIDTGENASPFDFFSDSDSETLTVSKGKNSMIIHGYLTPCANIFDKRCEEYLSDTLLNAYSREGITGLWFHALLSELSPYPFLLERSEKYKERRKELARLIERCERYGIKVYLYLNEPRALPIELLSKYSHIAGRREDSSFALCLENKEVKDYLYGAVSDLVKALPTLGGFITITMSENLTHCNYRPGTNCPVCKNIPPEKSASEVNNIIMRAVRDSGAKTEVIANLWGWSAFMGWTEEQTKRGISLLDPDISIMSVSEYDLEIEKGTVKSRIIDYSISNPGPSKVTRDSLSYAKSLGHRIYAKIQINNSWESSAAPYLPVFDLTLEHAKNLVNIGVSDYMLTWTLGGYPSPVISLLSEFISHQDTFDLDAWYKTRYGKNAERVHEAVKAFCKGFAEYPFSINSLYYSPKTLGPSNLFDIDASDKESAMVSFAFDDYEKWIEPYPYDVYISQYEKLLSEFERGISYLTEIGSDKEVRELEIYSRVAYIHFKSDYLQTLYSKLKREGNNEKIREILTASLEITRELNSLVKISPYIGFETSNHYFYTTRTLTEKTINLSRLIDFYS